MPLHKTAVPFKTKLKAVKYYLTSNLSLRAVAKRYKVSYRTLSYWVNQYKRSGDKGLIERKKRTKRLSQEIISQIMLLKEQNPSLSVNRAQQVFKHKKIVLSRQDIWQVWRMYGLSKKSLNAPLVPFCTPTSETAAQLKAARALVKKGDMKCAARLVNALPRIPRDPLIKEIPETLLTARRKMDRLYMEMGTMPWRIIVKKSRKVAALLEHKGYIYSSALVNFYELIGLEWLSKPEQSKRVLDRLREKMKRINNSALRFLFYMFQAATYCDTLQIGRAYVALKKCRKLVYHLSYRHWEDFGALLTVFGNNKDAARFYKRALPHTQNKTDTARISLKLGIQCYTMSGEYRACKRILTKTQAAEEIAGFSAIRNFGRALVAFGHGKLSESSKYYIQTLETASKEQLLNLLYATATGLATVEMALNNKKKAFTYIKKYLPLMKKYALLKETVVLHQLMSSKALITRELQRLPPFCLLHLLVHARKTQSIVDYRRAFAYAERQDLLGLFHRWSVFFPEPVIHLLQKGKKTGLPKPIVNLPVFNQNILVFHVKFLGRVIISRHNQYLRARITPTEMAFFIHLAQRAGAPGTSIPVAPLCQNFWSRSKKPLDRLLHLLVRIKKQLRIPSHLLSVSSVSGETRLLNRGVYVTTDYAEFETVLTQIKTLQRAGEWTYARRDYLRAFALLRGRPFEKMYDDWSERMRRVVMMTVEREAVNFADECLSHNTLQDAHKILERIQALHPDSQEIKQAYQNLRNL